jgi:hypothetical protein
MIAFAAVVLAGRISCVSWKSAAGLCCQPADLRGAFGPGCDASHCPNHASRGEPWPVSSGSFSLAFHLRRRVVNLLRERESFRKSR